MKAFLPLLLVSVLLPLMPPVMAEEAASKLTPSTVIEQSTASDWRQPEQANLMYLEIGEQRIVFELSATFAPNHVQNLKTLVGQSYFDGLAVIRSQDNYVAQWGDPAEDEATLRSLGDAKERIPHEFYRAKKGLNINTINSRDAYADEVGFVEGFAVGSDKDSKHARAWLTHCYGALGVGRGMELDSGNSSSLYMVTGHAPRHLDRNVTLIGRVIEGAEALSSLPRGTGPLGFYESADELTKIDRVRMGDTVPEAEQLHIEIMRTDTETFQNYVTARTHRLDDWFADPTGKIEVCNVGVPSRPVTQIPASE